MTRSGMEDSSAGRIPTHHVQTESRHRHSNAIQSRTAPIRMVSYGPIFVSLVDRRAKPVHLAHNDNTIQLSV